MKSPEFGGYRTTMSGRKVVIEEDDNDKTGATGATGVIPMDNSFINSEEESPAEKGTFVHLRGWVVW